MARLSVLRPQLAAPDRRLSILSREQSEQARSRCRDADQPWRRWYKTARWQKLRLSILSRDLYRCQLCGFISADMSGLVCDHIEPHEGNADKFWSGPFQTLCKPCHDGEKQRIDRAGKKAAFYPDWLRPSRIPLTIICGPPAAGKSAYVANRAQTDDLVIDLDRIAAGLSGETLHGWDRRRWLHPALFRRNDLLGRLSGRPRHAAAWFIICEPRAQWRQWWADKLQPQAIIVLATDEASCIKQAARDGERNQTETARAIRHWWDCYQPRSDDVVLSVP